MERQGNKIILGIRDCTWCMGRGVRSKPVRCPKCHGTRRGPRGGANGCRVCYYDGTISHPTEKVVCDSCHGTKTQPETLSDIMSGDNGIWESLEFKVIRTNAELTINEKYFGLGCVFSCEDYGAAYKSTDESVIADVKSHKIGIQASNIADENGNLCNFIAITVKTGGYNVKAIFKPLETIAAVKAEATVNA